MCVQFLVDSNFIIVTILLLNRSRETCIVIMKPSSGVTTCLYLINNIQYNINKQLELTLAKSQTFKYISIRNISFYSESFNFSLF